MAGDLTVPYVILFLDRNGTTCSALIGILSEVASLHSDATWAERYSVHTLDVTHKQYRKTTSIIAGITTTMPP
jgi:hypothetical protein